MFSSLGREPGKNRNYYGNTNIFVLRPLCYFALIAARLNLSDAGTR